MFRPERTSKIRTKHAGLLPEWATHRADKFWEARHGRELLESEQASSPLPGKRLQKKAHPALTD